MKTQLLSFLTFLLFTTGAYSQSWQRLPSMNTYSFNDDGLKFTEHNGTVYVYGYIGLYKSTDNGLNWTFLNKNVNSPSDLYVNDFAGNSAGIYIINEGDKLYKSIDNGNTWILSMNGIPADASCNYIFSVGNKLFVTGNDKLYVSNDNGANWSLSTGINGYFNNAYNLGSKLVITKADSIYTTTDGVSFLKYPLTGLPDDENIETVCGTDQNMFALVDDFVYRSSNGGSWDSISNNLQPNESVQGINYSNNKLIVTTFNQINFESKIYLSTDNGNTWTNLPITGLTIGGAEIFPVTGGYFAFTGIGFYYLPEGGTTWLKRIQGIDFVSAYTMVISDKTILNYSDFENGIQRSTDGGKTWATSNDGLPDFSGFYVLNEDGFTSIGKNIYMEVYTLLTTDLYRSTNHGSSWEKLTLPYENNSDFYLLGGKGDTIFLELRNKGEHIYRSTDAGETWTDIINNVPDKKLNEVVGNNNTLISEQYSRYGHPRIVKSTDGGINWTVASNGLDTTNFSFFDDLISGGANDFYLFADSYSSGTKNTKLYRSEDNGSTWQLAANTGLPSEYDVWDFVWDKGTLYLSTEEGGLYKSNNKGESWTSIKGDLPGAVTGKFGFIDNVVYVGSWGYGIWRTPVDRVAGINNTIMDNANFNVYPNPASESVIINYDLLDQKNVSIHILNAQGVVVKEFTNLNSSQRMPVEVNDLECGVYFVKLTFEDTSISKKLIIVK